VSVYFTMGHSSSQNCELSKIWGHKKENKCSAIAKMGDRFATIDMDQSSQKDPHLTQCGLDRGLPPYQVAFYPSSSLATTDMGQKLWETVPLCGGAGSPSNTTSPGPSSISVPSFISIHPTVWPQYTNVTDRQGLIA